MEKEVKDMILRLRYIQEDLGLDEAENPAPEETEKGFALIQTRIMNKIQEVKTTIDQRNDLSERGANRRKVIEKNALIYKKLKEIAVDYEKLKEKYEKDRKKLIRKPTEEEMRQRIEALQAIQKQIKLVQEKSDEGQKAMALDTTIGFEDNSTFDIKPEPVTHSEKRNALVSQGTDKDGSVHVDLGANSPDLTDAQQQGLLMIEQNQQEMDQMLEMISSGIDDLADIAQGMNSEIQKQAKMLDELDSSIDKTQTHLNETRKNLGGALQKTRQGDRFCTSMALLFCLIVVAVLIIQFLFKQ